MEAKLTAPISSSAGSPNSRHPCQGFTLTELLVVIVIIGLLAALTITGAQKVLSRSQQIECTSQMRQLFQAIELYRGDNNSSYPPANPWTPNTGNAAYLAWYTGDEVRKIYSPLADYTGGYKTLQKLAVCPHNIVSDPSTLPALVHNPNGYAYVVNYNVMVSNLTQNPVKGAAVPRPTKTLLMADAAGAGLWQGYGFGTTNLSRIGELHSGKTNFLWCDGHITLEKLSSITNTNITP